ncbi:MAG: hypothetical protein R6U78_12280 [Bacteroidales bacterium]
MNNLFTYLLELNMAMVIFFAGYKLFFERDRNFLVRRIYLLATIIIPVLMILLPDIPRSITGRMIPMVIHLDQITVTAHGQAHGAGGLLSPWSWLMILYLSVAALCMTRMIIHLIRIRRAVKHSARLELDGITLYANPGLHASSFFGYIFVDPARIGQESFSHILGHEQIHRREWHSVDRILTELFVIVNWFNPVAWLLRSSVIENLEYHTDSVMVKQGTDPRHYQLSILNQYIGSASITNQFNSQIKNRINMLNRNDRMGSSWKLAMIFPIVLITFILASCTEKDVNSELENETVKKSTITESKIYQQVDEMPTFQGGELIEFRKFIAKNIIYPREAKENNVTGKIFVVFVVRDDGKVVIPDPEELPPPPEKNNIDEVVVAAYRPLDKEAPMPDEKYIELLKNEAVRVVTSSPNWEPGKIKGKPVNVMFTFPINFVLQ